MGAAAGGVTLAACDDRILQAQVFARHGARTPLSEVDGLPVPAAAFETKPTPSSGTPAVDTRNVNVRGALCRGRDSLALGGQWGRAACSLAAACAGALTEAPSPSRACLKVAAAA